MRDAAVKRIEDVKALRARQFLEDDGPLVHPPRPASFIEIDNFYTATVYEKGAEICRMLRTLLGEATFRRAMDLYIARNDGTAATVEDFLAAMADASGRDLTQFALWYGQAGRPTVSAETHYDETARVFEITLSQTTRATPGEAQKKPYHIPIAVGLLDAAGHDIALQLEGEPASAARTTRVLELTAERATYRFIDCPRPEARSLLRGFSAPITLQIATTEEEDRFLLAHDSRPVQPLGIRPALGDTLPSQERGRVAQGVCRSRPTRGLSMRSRATLEDQSLEPAFKALALSLPSLTELGQAAETPVDFEALHEARTALKSDIGKQLSQPLARAFDGLKRSKHRRHRSRDRGPARPSSQRSSTI